MKLKFIFFEKEKMRVFIFEILLENAKKNQYKFILASQKGSEENKKYGPIYDLLNYAI